MNKKIIVILSVTFLIVLYVVGSSMYKSHQLKKLDFMAKENASTFVRPHAQTLGSDDAKVYIVEFFDPACETCRQMYYGVKQILKNYPGKIKLVMRYAPFHHGADEVVKILEASRKQDKYWETLETLYKYQNYWASHHQAKVELIWDLLANSGIDVDQIKIDMQSPEIAQLIKQDMADVKTLNVRKTPEFFVNGKPLPRFGYNELVTLVQEEIKAQYGE